MSSFPDAASGQDLLEAGLAAIKQGQYPQAIDSLNQCLSTAPADSTKAKMGLVVAYSRSQQKPTAIALCQELLQLQNPKVQDWATRTLAELEETAETGFVPLESSQSGKRRSVFIPSKQSSSQQPETPAEDTPLPAVSSASPRPLSSPEPLFRSSVRPTRWQPLAQLNPARLQWAEMGAIASLVALIYIFCSILTALPNAWLSFSIRFLGARGVISTASVSVWAIAACLFILWAASPWILDGILKGIYGMKPLLPATLSRSSPETYRLLQRFAQERKSAMPTLSILRSEAPLIFTYGSLPKVARIVVSQGLLNELTDEEIAALYAAELGHIKHWDFSVMSLVAVVTQIPYAVYGLSEIASDRLTKSANQGKTENAAGASQFLEGVIAILLKVAAGITHLIAAVNYGAFWYLRGAGFWLSRQRILYSDRDSCNLTGNPNALTRAILKSAIATCKTIQKQGKTDYLLESFEFLTPIGYRAALSVGSLSEHVRAATQIPLGSLLFWDQVNASRNRLVLLTPHPLLGERLERLARYAKQWNTQPEVELEQQPSGRAKKSTLYFAPILGAAIGFGIALLLWIIAQTAFRFGNNSLNWLASDYKLFTGFALIGFGMGSILRFNALFPDLQRLSPKQAEATVSLIDLLTKPEAVPLDSTPVRLVGTLLGRSGSSNALVQDLILETPAGMIRLNYCSQLGKIGNLIPEATRPVDLIGQSVTITGWFRRGATPWIDVEAIRSERGRTTQSGHQVWATLTAIAALMFGIFTIL